MIFWGCYLGIIFQPNRPYIFGNDPYLLKWKFVDLRSIDVQVIHDTVKDSLSLICSGPDGVQIDISKRGSNALNGEGPTLFGNFDKYRLLCEYYTNHVNLFNGNLNKHPFIAEVSFDTEVGLWKYIKYRSDKDEPNYIDTVLGVLLEQAENISLDEIKCLQSTQSTSSSSGKTS